MRISVKHFNYIECWLILCLISNKSNDKINYFSLLGIAAINPNVSYLQLKVILLAETMNTNYSYQLQLNV